MKSSQLLDLYNKGKLQKRSARWFRNLGNVEGSVNLPQKVRELIARKSLEAVPKNIRRFIDMEHENTEILIKNQANMSTSEDKYDFFKTVYDVGDKSLARRWDMQKKEVWSAFKSQRPDVYNSYNSWMWRRGKSGVNYWYDNVEFDSGGSHGIVTTTLDVSDEEYTIGEDILNDPSKLLRMHRASRSQLVIEYDFYDKNVVFASFE